MELFSFSGYETFFLFSIITATVLDLLLADPDLKFHPVILIGKLISFLENNLNRGSKSARIVKGALCVIAALSIVFTVFYFFEYGIVFYFVENSILPEHPFTSKIIGAALYAAPVFFFLAGESLIKEGRNIFIELKNSLNRGRKQLSRIVGRDVSNLNEQEIKRAALESMSENLCDGVIAPLFYFFLGGLPLMAVYKTINTLDSMIAYKNDRFMHFGFAAAKLDDMANYIPSRITALLYILVSGKPKALKTLWQYARQHESPNAGYPESALAGILNIRLGGPAIYHGQKKEKAWLGSCKRDILESDLQKTVLYNRLSFLIFLVAGTLLKINTGIIFLYNLAA